MLGPKIKIYTAVKMTGRMQDELLMEDSMLHRTLENYGFEQLSPVAKEGLKNTHFPLAQISLDDLSRKWKMDKEMIQESDIILDYKSCGQSDGVNKEIAYARYCLWMPVIRVYPKLGITISRLEDDVIVDTLEEALNIIKDQYGSYQQLFNWHRNLLERSFDKWWNNRQKRTGRYRDHAVCR